MSPVTDSRSSKERITSVAYFNDTLVNQVIWRGRPLTAPEREFLCTDTPSFEECQPEKEPDLRALNDKDLMRRCYEVWADYASGQI